MVAVVYGSSTDNTKATALAIAAALEARTGTPIDLIDVATIRRKLEPLLAYRVLIIGCSTWNIGELQDDWDVAFGQLQSMDWSNTTVALFGWGDMVTYPYTYQDALGILGRALRERGATLVGRWPTDSYEFYESAGVEDGSFMGLALDDNQPELADARVEGWVEQLAVELRQWVEGRRSKVEGRRIDAREQYRMPRAPGY